MGMEAAPADLGSADEIHSPITKDEGGREGLKCAMSVSFQLWKA